MNKLESAVVWQLIIVAVLLVVGLAWMVFQWGVCRDMGFSVWYCVQHIV